MRSTQRGQNGTAVQSGILGQGPRDDLQRPGEGTDGVLVEAGAGVGVVLDLDAQVHLGGAGAGDEPPVAAGHLGGVDPVVDGPLQVGQGRAGGGPEEDGGQAASPLAPGLVLAEDGHLPAADLLDLDGVAVPHLVGGGGSQPDQGRRSGGRAQPAQVELGRAAEAHEAIPLDEVEGHLADGAAADDDLAARVGDRLDDLLDLLLLGFVVALEVVGVLHQHGALGLGAAGLDAAAEDGDLGIGRGGGGRLAAAEGDEAPDDARFRNVAAQDFGYPDGIGVDRGSGLGAGGAHGPEAGIDDEGGQDVLAAVLLGAQDRPDDADEAVPVPRVVDGLDGQAGEELQHPLPGLLVPLDDLAGVQAHPQQILRLAQQLPGEADGQVGPVAALFVLRVAGHAEHLGGGVLDLQLADDGGAVRRDDDPLEVVDHQLVHAVGPQGRRDDPAQIPRRLDVPEDRGVGTRQVLVARFEHPREAGGRVEVHRLGHDGFA
mmetsp:Transcript_16157/g.46395  ORF Transcript_16157/g.46395 Transcript_16157/m.46395 type:complete len:487 (+) Transcript_16157:331-1791(+)